MKLRKRQRRRGMTLVETLVALIIMALGVIVMARITAAKVQEQTSIDSQYVLLNIDAVLSDIYHDFHAAEVVNAYESGTGDDLVVSLNFDLGDGVVRLYAWVAKTGKLYVNGIEQFSCSAFEVRYTADNLYVAVRTPNEKRLDIDIFR